MTEKYIRQVDTSIKLCYKCDSKAVIVEDKKYYCASCALQKLPMDKNVLRKKDKTPEENLAIAKIQVMFEDAFGISSSDSTPAVVDRAKRWFETRDCALWCDMAGTIQDHVQKLFQNMQYNYNSKKITIDNVRFGIRRLNLKL